MPAPAGKQLGQLGDVAMPSVSGPPVDLDFTAPQDGMLALDAVSGLLYHRANGIWQADAVGWATLGLPIGYGSPDAFGTVNLPVSGGALLTPIAVPSPMLLQDYIYYNNDAAGAHTLEVRLYLDASNNSATATFVAGTDTTFTFTPSAATIAASNPVSGAPATLPAGVYWLVIRNTSGAVAANIQRLSAPAGSIFGTNGAESLATQTLGSALGSTLDLISGWTKVQAAPSVAIRGRVLGQTSGY